MVQERVRTVRMFMREPTTTRTYDLYVRNTMIDPWSQVNFYKNCDEESDLSVSNSVIIAYLFGVLAGINEKESYRAYRAGCIC